MWTHLIFHTSLQRDGMEDFAFWLSWRFYQACQHSACFKRYLDFRKSSKKKSVRDERLTNKSLKFPENKSKSNINAWFYNVLGNWGMTQKTSGKILFTWLSCARSGELELIFCAHLDRSPIYHSADTETFRLTLTARGNFHLTQVCMFMHCGRKQEHPGWTLLTWGEHADSTQKGLRGTQAQNLAEICIVSHTASL